jgi:hypothetical protein
VHRATASLLDANLAEQRRFAFDFDECHRP